MHAIAEMVRRLRANPGQYGLVAANGGFLSKYSVGVYSARPAAWGGFDSQALQAEVDAWPAPAVAPGDGTGIVETYTIDYSGKAPVGTVVGRLTDGGARFAAITDPEDPKIVQQMIASEPIGAAVTAKLNGEGRAILVDFVPAL
jgi:acetyl-CoA C-acetyltransferase